MSDNPAQIVRFWHAVEMFSPQALPHVDAKNHVVDFRPGDPMPWEAATKAQPQKVWRHEVFAGVYDLSRVRDVLIKKYDEDDPEAAPVRGQSALFACTVDADGYLVPESGVVSACAWAIGQVERGKPTLTGFRGDAEAFTEELRKQTGVAKLLADSIRNAAPDAVAGAVTAVVTGALAPTGPLAPAVGAMAGKLAGQLTKSAVGAKDDTTAPANARKNHLDQAPLTGADLFGFTKDLASRLGVTTVLDPRNIRVNSYQINEARAGEPPDQPTFLNSYIVDDLALVSTALNRSDAGTALTQYLTADPGVPRTDVQLNPLVVRDLCFPERIPPGRWVTSTERPLAFSQQFAVNQIIETLGDSAGLFAVNGPPGTGKTTMLRDVIAAVIVRRAMALASLDSPSQAFTAVSELWPTATRPHTITAPSPALTGFEMVVASSNNGAVENVTNEIPGPKGIDDQWRAAAAAVDYFSTTAGQGNWAMVAARLGNRANRNSFVQDFWFSGDASMRAVLNTTPPATDWRGAVADFRTALARVTALSSERTVVARAITRLPGAQRDQVLAEAAGKVARERLANLQAQLPEINRRSASAHRRWQLARESLHAHMRGKPGWFAFLSARRRQARRAWNAERAELSDRFTTADRERVHEQHAVDELDTRMNKVRQAQSEADASLSQLGRELAELRQCVEGARQRWSDHVPDGPQYAQTQDPEAISLREKSAPWADPEFTAARTELFLAALRLHKALILAQAPTFRRNLSALMDILAGKGRPSDAAALAAWQTFFLVVPVVSTTFASFDRLFGGLGRESVGWLFADEAGQAPPQYAVGALWRARRAVLVGDPLQLKPVVTLPWGGQRALLREFDAGEQWAPSRTSVQQVADRLAAHGTSLPGPAGAEPVWVGTPLRVHRRCERPMFDICNQIAYDGLMVYGTPDRGAFHGRDTWYDISSTQSEGHWVPAEGHALHTMLSRLRDAGIPADQIRVISPFRLVAAKSAGVHETVFHGVTGDQRKHWVGTVHTMQGKEADVVILILGGDPARPGARRFATEEPNLLNVAVSRARRRLYVIGSRDFWGSQPYFDVLARRISVTCDLPPSPRGWFEHMIETIAGTPGAKPPNRLRPRT